MTVNRRLLLAVTGWLVTALIATGAGIAVIGLLGESLTGPSGDVLSAEEVGQELARAAASPRPSASPSSPPPTAATPTPAPTPAKTPMSKVITTRGGSVVARCDDGRVTLRSWSPAQGYEIDDVDPGPGDRARVKFEREHDDVEIEIRCSAVGPVHTVKTD